MKIKVGLNNLKINSEITNCWIILLSFRIYKDYWNKIRSSVKTLRLLFSYVSRSPYIHFRFGTPLHFMPLSLSVSHNIIFLKLANSWLDQEFLQLAQALFEKLLLFYWIEVPSLFMCYGIQGNSSKWKALNNKYKFHDNTTTNQTKYRLAIGSYFFYILVQKWIISLTRFHYSKTCCTYIEIENMQKCSSTVGIGLIFITWRALLNHKDRVKY